MTEAGASAGDDSARGSGQSETPEPTTGSSGSGVAPGSGDGTVDTGSAVGESGAAADETSPATDEPGTAQGAPGTATDETSAAKDRSDAAAAESGAANHEAERNEGAVNSVETSNFEQFRDDLDAVERRIAGEIDPGVRAMVVAGAVFVLLFSLVLPHAGGARGFDVLLGTEIASTEHIGLPSRIFVWFAVIFAVGFSTLALMTRRWILAWIAVAGTAITSVFGVFSIWHRQTPGIGNYHGAGPGIGLILGVIAAIVLTFHWIRVVWSRTALQLAAEEQRRNATAAQEEQDRRRLTGE